VSGPRQYPESVEAERALLGGLLQAPDVITYIADRLRPEHFTRSDHAALFALLEEMTRRKETVDLVTLPRRLLADGRSAEVYGGVAYVLELPDYAPSTANLEHYATVIRDQALLRELIRLSEGLSRRAGTPAADAGALIEEGMKDLANLATGMRSTTWSRVSELLDEEMSRLSSLLGQNVTVPGLTTGFRELNEKLAGFKPGQLIILAARPGMGKTALALNMAQRAALEGGQGVGIFSLEMERAELVNRLVVSHAMVDSNLVRMGRLTQVDWNKLDKAADELRYAPIFLDDTAALTLGNLRVRARKLKAENPNLGLLVIDYLQLMQGDDPRVPRIQQVSDISRGLKALAKDLKVPVLALSQLNRAVESRQDKRPLLSDLRESGSIEQDADVILMIYRDDYYNKESSEPGVSEVIIAKQRAGATGTVKLVFQGHYLRFDDLIEAGPLT
jgi:replicative DNA helicase